MNPWPENSVVITHSSVGMWMPWGAVVWVDEEEVTRRQEDQGKRCIDQRPTYFVGHEELSTWNETQKRFMMKKRPKTQEDVWNRNGRLRGGDIIR